MKDEIRVFNNFDDWSFYMKNTKESRHKLLKDLVAEHYPSVYNDYGWLLSMSWEARYNCFHFDKNIVDRAVRIMRIIKNLSESLKTESA